MTSGTTSSPKQKQSIAAWLTGTNGWVALPIIAAFFIIAYGSVLFNWNNLYSHAVHAATIGWHLIGWLLTGLWIALFIRAENMGNTKAGDIIAIGVALVLALCAFTGFFFQ